LASWNPSNSKMAPPLAPSARGTGGFTGKKERLTKGLEDLEKNKTTGGKREIGKKRKRSILKTLSMDARVQRGQKILRGEEKFGYKEKGNVQRGGKSRAFASNRGWKPGGRENGWERIAPCELEKFETKRDRKKKGIEEGEGNTKESTGGAQNHARGKKKNELPASKTYLANGAQTPGEGRGGDGNQKEPKPGKTREAHHQRPKPNFGPRVFNAKEKEAGASPM